MTFSAGDPIRLIGGRLALDFTNTADWLPDGRIFSEKLETWPDIAAWLDFAGVDEMPPEPIAALHNLRAQIRDSVLTSLAEPDETPDTRLLAERIDPRPASTFSSRLAVSAIALLLDPHERRRIKICPGDNCGWLFIDETGRGKRHWCAMDICGNRAKARRHYARVKAEG